MAENKELDTEMDLDDDFEIEYSDEEIDAWFASLSQEELTEFNGFVSDFNKMTTEELFERLQLRPDGTLH